MEKVLVSLTDLEMEARALVGRLSPTPGAATLITLSGELGAGKTAFTQAVAKAYGVSESVTSPTFVLEKVYTLPAESGFAHLIHIDAYRLESAEELKVLGWDSLLKEEGNLILLEWPEHVASALPKASVAIRLVPQADGSRLMSYA
ncbi:MAG: tRNA (adenosine(37)-N6)-threonylcarbamoyltransferase complex ATPase subunit type 1 TsaE [Candidatus Pacebacteria bacterium]|nr:tRNA (adenosine(37)-N6)-threonylcarbamoyltransferase complex ATPase subunit type 1 TsaE [Candidatus Paceibacterota bacterium]